MKIKNIFFDFDGVLAESVSAKTDAFKEMYLPYGNEIASKVVDHHINHGGVSRYEKFKIYHNEFLNKEISEQEVQEMAMQFSDLVLQKVIDADEVSGAKEFLNKYYKKLNFWIITGTPTPEIKIITNKRNLSSYFLGLHGSPEKKRYWTEYLLKTHSLKREETLFLGDATTDQDAADFSNLHFALRENEENSTIFRNFEGQRFKDFHELENNIKQHF